MSTIRRLALEPPTPGQAQPVASGIWWIRLPIRTQLRAVNVYLLDGGSTWTLVDTGEKHADAAEQLQSALAPLVTDDKPLRQIIATHCHRDHIGLAGMFASSAVRLLASETCWQIARRLWHHGSPRDQQQWLTRAGVKPLERAAMSRIQPIAYASAVHELPGQCELLREGQELAIGDRTWTVQMGYGHAEEHVTLWSDDGVALVGDQILPSTAPNLSVPCSDPEATPVPGWLESCERFRQLATEETLCLPGHNLPFRGVPQRCQQLIDNSQNIINRLRAHLVKPSTADGCLQAAYRRPLGQYERRFLLSETMGYLNHLRELGVVERRLTKSGHLLWKLPTRSP